MYDLNSSAGDARRTADALPASSRSWKGSWSNNRGLARKALVVGGAGSQAFIPTEPPAVVIETLPAVTFSPCHRCIVVEKAAVPVARIHGGAASG